ncbi:TetR/AcrR family transcriptional regulator [Tenggerimyces flavus]|uniref:TetR/AcrR family transcriptional regulator n=1 Tax=Tenggerimyces flavus TaxID=1708749 RepID=A0ABV7YJ26_9ACTN|nr:TetR/AcrR family transcriptional regulator [Tenggerimyces flavus]MBM7784693.1 AcrR family transcriptional regulator [Tenggerimyces flavus]
MARLTRAQQQDRTRAAVLAAARAEFAARGYADAKVDQIAERAELTRGAVYSNFPSKRALYLAVLVDSLDDASAAAQPLGSVAEALGAFARVWFERLPLTGHSPADGRLRLRSLAGVVDDERGRVVLGQVARLEALLLGRALESLDAQPMRRVRLAELVLTLLNGVGQLAETAPGFGDPFDVARACEHLADLDLGDTWDPPHLAFVRSAELVDEPSEGDDGLMVVLGTSRLGAAEEAIRAAGSGELVTVVLATNDRAELGRLVALRIGDLLVCLRRVFGPDPVPRLRLVLDSEETGDDSEVAVRVARGRVVARAQGPGAGHAVGVAQVRGIPNVESRSS